MQSILLQSLQQEAIENKSNLILWDIDLKKGLLDSN